MEPGTMKTGPTIIDNAPGAEIVVVEACGTSSRPCPNRLIGGGKWKAAIEDWVRERDINEKVRSRLGSEMVKPHQRFHIAISSCPNGCARHQVADIGIEGFLRPDFDPAGCRRCGGCAEVCPDLAINMGGGTPWFDLARCKGCLLCSRACPRGCIETGDWGARIYMGGKLGRRPRLGELVAEVGGPEEAVAVIDPIVDLYIVNAKTGERFGDWLLRRREEAVK